jgi:hypothetical protein
MKVSSLERQMGEFERYVYVCEGTTASGESCTRETARGLQFCYQHDPDQLCGKAVKFDALKRESYLQALRDGCTRTTAARSVSMSRQGVWSYCERHPEFSGLISNAEMSAAGDVENALHKAALKGSISACIFILKNRVPDSWSNDDNSPQQEANIDLSALTHAELIEARRLSAKVKLIPAEETP